MLNSSSSTPPSIKTRHRIAKSRPRRRRIDLQCGCSIYFHIDCAGHGFTHRGTHHCASGREWRFYLADSQSPLFHGTESRGSTIHQDKNIPRPDTVQPQPQEGVGSTEGVPELPSLDDVASSFWDDIFS
ncbi:transactivator protein [Whitefly-associated begomovirus 1]|uniref:Transcriptional activator protein n=1 Tax=Whitefly-associated begomovirus 1 TaxID=2169739 RepID=A0A0P0J5E6_9GEMI|nr:transactivator protein [Whitefly-associated begomovirus 1]ALK03428.1 transactivator protein [Whitefly-associated begomovirus 1]ALK03433.1 transactivator protein [Whitefly-associated begomovirus 1]ALK03438.1 transactivator protein [Whitefly-associated begomovirus 1]